MPSVLYPTCLLDKMGMFPYYRTGNQKDESEELEEWLPDLNDGKTKKGRQKATGKMEDGKPATKRVAKPKEPKTKVERKPRTVRAPKAKKDKSNTEQQPEDTNVSKPASQQLKTVKEEVHH